MSDNIKKYIKVLAALRKEGILTDKKDFTCQIGEWLVEQLYNGKRAPTTNQKGWDVKVGSNSGRLVLSLSKGEDACQE
jgi:hypothetical protein